VTFLRIYFPFAAGYLLSYLFRTVNAVISPELQRDVGLDPSSLGLLTGAYFLAFGAAQIPVGMLLDRFGPRRVESVLLVVAVAGALLFATADSLAALAFARAVIGLGVCACLMAPLKAIAVWHPPERLGSLAGWIMVAGGLGALAATTPLEYALRITGWRNIFMGLAMATLAVALFIAWRVPDIAKPVQGVGIRAQWTGVRSVFRHPRFWWIAPLGALCMGSFFAIQGLWAVPWMMEVDGLPRSGAARNLLWMGIATLLGFLSLGMFGTRLARRGVHARHIFAAGFGMAVLALAAIFLRLPGGFVWWVLYGLGTSTNVLAFAVVNEGFGRDLAGRSNTALNLMMFGGSFIAQWGIGVVAETARRGFALDEAGGLRVAFGLMLAGNVATYAWFVRGWRRHATAAGA
jgi:predicted MFS family arabinose efflux permease